MTDTIRPPRAGSVPSDGIAARALGIVFSPRATYARVAARPRALGTLTVVIFASTLPVVAFLSTEVGRMAALDHQMSVLEAFGVALSDPQMQALEASMPYWKYYAAVGQAVILSAGALVVAGLARTVFNMKLGADAPYRQVFAVVVHSGFLLVLQALVVLPWNYARETMSTPTSLATFLPVLDDTSFAGRLFGSIDLLRVWWVVNLSIGLGVLYQRRPAPIAGAMLAIYAAIALTLAAAMTASLGV